jgi:nitrite reductase/ring-hydroxylating ferredoxin subunit
MQPGALVCLLTDVSPGKAIVVVLGPAASRHEVIVVRDDAGVRGFINVCPHNPLPLNIDARIYSRENHVHCDHHFAKFRFSDGLCTAGVCFGERLTLVPLSVCGERVVIGEMPTV